MNLELYGLLHLKEDEQSAMNMGVSSFETQKQIYLKNASVLSMSLRNFNIPFYLLTNKQAEVNETLKQMALDHTIEVREIDFNISIPSGINFYSAHYKLDVFNYLSKLEADTYVGLVDLDIIAINPPSTSFINLVQAGVPLCYDISDQVIPSASHDRIIDDLKKLSADSIDARWCGGEFLAGKPDFFAQLCAEINLIYPTYTSIFEEMHHQGDEIITTAAINRLRKQGMYIADAGPVGIVGRFWSVPTDHGQKSFDYFKTCTLLHLPADKKFIASIQESDIATLQAFLKRYLPYLRLAKFKNAISKLIMK